MKGRGDPWEQKPVGGPVGLGMVGSLSQRQAFWCLSHSQVSRDDVPWGLLVTCSTNDYPFYETFCHAYIFVDYKREERGGVMLEELWLLI